MQISLQELSNVKGIGKKTIQRIREYKLKEEGYISEYDKEIHLNENTINLGDCLELMNGIPDKSIDMLLADLPYNVTQNDWDSVIHLDKLWLQYERIIKDNGVIVLTSSQKFTTKLINSNTNLFRYDLIWYKPLGTGFLNANRMPMRNHEHILIFYKELPTYNPQFGVGKRKKGKRKRDRTGDCYGDLNNESEEQLYYDDKGKRFPKSVIEISNGDRTKENDHPTQKPVKLFEYLIKTYTNEGDLVLDNVSGSGTTAVACINTNRNYICIEQNEEYYKLSKERVNNL